MVHIDIFISIDNYGTPSCRLWNMNSFELLSKTTLEQKIRSCSFDHDGGQLAAGLMDGSFMVLKSRLDYYLI